MRQLAGTLRFIQSAGLLKSRVTGEPAPQGSPESPDIDSAFVLKPGVQKNAGLCLTDCGRRETVCGDSPRWHASHSYNDNIQCGVSEQVHFRRHRLQCNSGDLQQSSHLPMKPLLVLRRAVRQIRLSKIRGLC